MRGLRHCYGLWAGVFVLAVFWAVEVPSAAAASRRSSRTERRAAETPAASTVEVPGGKTVIPLHRDGNSLFVDVKLNRKTRGRFLLDTGCSETQVASRFARKSGIRTAEGQKAKCRIAGGRVVNGRLVNLRELTVGSVTARNVPVIVLRRDKGGYDGLLGMSFLKHFVFAIDPVRGELTLQRR